MPDLAYWVGVIKDVITALAAVTAAVVATKGLQTWRKQLRGNAEFDVARRLLLAVYQTREALKRFIWPVISTAERDAAAPKQPEIGACYYLSDPVTDSIVRERRWQAVMDRQAELRVVVLESEALWGEDVPKGVRPIYKLSAEMMWAYGNHSPASDEVAGAIGDQLGPAEIEKRLNDWVLGIESLVRPHLLSRSK